MTLASKPIPRSRRLRLLRASAVAREILTTCRAAGYAPRVALEPSGVRLFLPVVLYIEDGFSRFCDQVRELPIILEVLPE